MQGDGRDFAVAPFEDGELEDLGQRSFEATIPTPRWDVRGIPFRRRIDRPAWDGHAVSLMTADGELPIIRMQ